jgi:hypothetical protein
MGKFVSVADNRPEAIGLDRGSDRIPGALSPDRRLIAPGRTRPADLSFAVSSDRYRFAAKVRAGRAILGWSQTELARRTGLSQRSIYRLELAAVDVRRSTVVAIETVFANAGVDFEHQPDGGFKVAVSGSGLVRQ